MGSVGSSRFTRTEEDIRKSSIIFGKAAIVNLQNGGGYVDIDGYFYAKSEGDLLTKLAKTVDLYNKDEANGLRDLVKFDEIGQIHADRNAGPAQFILEWEDVPGASQWDEENDEMKYSDKKANYYVHVRFVR